MYYCIEMNWIKLWSGLGAKTATGALLI